MSQNVATFFYSFFSQVNRHNRVECASRSAKHCGWKQEHAFVSRENSPIFDRQAIECQASSTTGSTSFHNPYRWPSQAPSFMCAPRDALQQMFRFESETQLPLLEQKRNATHKFKAETEGQRPTTEKKNVPQLTTLPHLEELDRRSGGIDEHGAQAAGSVHASVGGIPVIARSCQGRRQSAELYI